MGCPVEIEFAIDLKKDQSNKATFYLLQIKPLIGVASDFKVSIDKILKKDIWMFTEKGMGNGIINNIRDVVYVDYSNFKKTQTDAMAVEIEQINKTFNKDKKKYILVGPGRWGTRDRFIGIPVNWPQISNAKVIIETSMADFPLDASSGSHFFHNVVSMNVGYFTVQTEVSKSYIQWDVLDQQKLIKKTKYFRHIRFDHPVKVLMDGKKRIAVITWENVNSTGDP